MVSRTRKLLVASAVIAAGIGLAWPFYHGTGEPRPAAPQEDPETQAERLTAPVILPPAQPPASTEPTTTRAQLTGDRGATLPAAPVAPAAAVSRPAPPPPAPPLPVEFPPESAVAESDLSPVYATSKPRASEQPSTDRQIHVVHNGDTLGRLAHRYLGDDARALEIFDLNRHVLDNPHLLPIGAEIEIPDRTSPAASPHSIEPTNRNG